MTSTMTSETTSVSILLKNARKEQGLAIKAVAQDICVQSGYLKAIESGTYDKLPAQTFAVGFVRSYANALGQDGEAIATAFKKECGTLKPDVTNAVSTQAKPRRKLPGWLSPIAGLAGASLVWVALGTSFGGATLVADAHKEIADEVAQLAALQSDIAAETGIVDAANATVTPETDLIDHAEGALASAAQKETSFLTASLFLPAAYAEEETPVYLTGTAVLLEALEDSWVRVSLPNGKELWSGILREGQTYRPREGGNMLLTTSNAGGLMVKQGAADAINLGARGEIVTDYAFGFEKLMSHNSAAVADPHIAD